MQVFRSLADIPDMPGRSVVAIGNFDGVHCGHQAILAEVRKRGQMRGAVSVAVTFDPHPVRVLRPEMAPKLITPMPQRLELLAQTGIDATLILPFTEEFSQTPAYDFADQVLARALRAVEVHEGESFRFGRDAEAGTEDLIRFGKQLGFEVFGHRALMVRGITVSSSEVRQRIVAGNTSLARALLGRAFSIESTQERGRGVGSKLLVPTINLAPYAELTPANGVYVTRVRVGERWFEAVTNCGVRPTFGVESYAIESYLLNFEPVEIEPETPVEVCFLARLREEQKFPSAEALKEQIIHDVAKAKRYHGLAAASR
ncbi:MAG: bifunctional riboflavin kinase/FAD synthetase [Acidobacteria bacterium]|jgi:riboflavin kinase/FMN adenylyltransferase|nr:bifunctional riboflavin kinase/FAD synthetase [Acidobacteriota bacterium]